jgi:hypothetical protein
MTYSYTLPYHICYWIQNQILKDVHESPYRQSADHQESICSQILHHVLGLQSEIYLTNSQETVIKVLRLVTIGTTILC